MSRLSPFVALLCLAVLACSGRTPEPTLERAVEPDTKRVTALGQLVGTRDAYGSFAWLGVPFARPPSGELRWRAPQPPEPWEGTLEATAFGPDCPQLASTFGGNTSAEPGTPVGQEDCLTLTIWSPPLAPDEVPNGDERLPVMFWIHGGGNTIGTPSFYNGGNLATTQRTIVVAIHYRLGPFGWFGHPALREGASPADASGNYGVLDQVRALEWVREHISAFGGDPHNVTIFGESAGGRNVYALLVSPQAKGLFHRAIVQSGGLGAATLAEAMNPVDATEPGQDNSSAEVTYKLLQNAGRAADRDAARALADSMSRSELAAFLRERSAGEIMGGYEVGMAGMFRMPQMLRDGHVLPKTSTYEAFVAGNYHRVPIMTGSNRDEVKLFQFFNPEYTWQLLGFLPIRRDTEQYALDAEYGSDAWKAAAVDDVADALIAHQSDVYAYRFDWDEEPSRLGIDLGDTLGAAHGFEIPFVFGHFDIGATSSSLFTEGNLAGRRALSDAMMSYWAEFAYAGKPGRGRDGKLPAWSSWSREKGANKLALLDSPAGGGPLAMSPDRLTTLDLAARIENDSRLAGVRDKCARYAQVVLRDGSFGEDSYAKLGGSGCAEYPVAAYPWDEE